MHGGDDVTGALRSVLKATTGLSWRQVAEPLLVTGTPGREQLDACRELGATVAVHLTL